MLSIRLKSILDYLNPDDLVADIGTDHGYLLEACMEKGIKFGQGIENKKGPYDRALLTLQPYIDENKIKLTLCDGLEMLDPMVDTVVIAGMGGELISQIISANIEKAKKLKKLVLEPNIRIYELRDFLNQHYFRIIDETVVEDNNKFYEILVVCYDENCQLLNEKEKMFGPILLKSKTPCFINKWNYRIKQINDIFEKNNQTIEELLNQKQLILEVLND